MISIDLAQPFAIRFFIYGFTEASVYKYTSKQATKRRSLCQQKDICLSHSIMVAGNRYRFVQKRHSWPGTCQLFLEIRMEEIGLGLSENKPRVVWFDVILSSVFVPVWPDFSSSPANITFAET